MLWTNHDQVIMMLQSNKVLNTGTGIHILHIYRKYMYSIFFKYHKMHSDALENDPGKSIILSVFSDYLQCYYVIILQPNSCTLQLDINYILERMQNRCVMIDLHTSLCVSSTGPHTNTQPNLLFLRDVSLINSCYGFSVFTPNIASFKTY